MAEVVVVGSLMIDLVSFTDRLPKPGETIHGKSFVQNFGGKGANQCVAASKLGAKTAMVGKVGDDQFGSSYKRYLSKADVDTTFLHQEPATSTGIASIWVDSEGQNSIIITANANEKVTPETVEASSNLITSANVLICQREIPLEASLKALQIAKAAKVRSIFNPAPATSLPDEFLKALDIICPNESEAEILVGFPVDAQDSCQRALNRLLEMGANTAIITLGSKGAAFAFIEEPEAHFVSTAPSKVLDSTGAGDAFIGALAFFIAREKGSSMAENIRRACLYASDSVTKLGTQISYGTMKDLGSSFFV